MVLPHRGRGLCERRRCGGTVDYHHHRERGGDHDNRDGHSGSPRSHGDERESTRGRDEAAGGDWGRVCERDDQDGHGGSPRYHGDEHCDIAGDDGDNVD